MPLPRPPRRPGPQRNQRAPSQAAGRDNTPQIIDPAVGTNTGDRPPKKRANIVTLNMNGASTPTQNLDMKGKWATISYTMRVKRTAILTLQEMHLDAECLQEIQECFDRKLTIYNSQGPENPTSSARVAFVLNNALITLSDLKLHMLEPGQALGITLKWVETRKLSIINIYMPNNKGHQAECWP